jgi:hypothetical protein
VLGGIEVRSMPPMKKEDEKVLECSLCQKKYGVDDVKNSSFFASTMTCALCYSSAVRGDAQWCFGSFDIQHRDCRIECPDRRICKLYTKHEFQKTQGE